jgi:ribosome-binding protein aMBF1 (putative translation factor)
VDLATQAGVGSAQQVYLVDPKETTPMPATATGAKSSPDTSVADRVLPTVGANIVARRDKLGMSQRALADKAGVDRVFLRDVERGTGSATLVFLAKLAAALDTTIEKLTHGV